ncbi:MAG: DUF11 domain-containing protein, partial [Coleofasciculaceae cyanobacterium]
MKYYKHKLRSFKLFLAVILTAFLIIGASSTVAKEITNTATASGDNFQPVNSNPTTLVAGQAVLELLKTADRAAAEPGDTVIYRLALRNTGDASARNITITDTAPLGLRFLPESLKASVTTVGGASTPVTLPAPVVANRNVTFTYPILNPKETLTIVYAAVVTP